MHCWNATQYYSTETVLLIFLFLQTWSDEAKWRIEGGFFSGTAILNINIITNNIYEQNAQESN